METAKKSQGLIKCVYAPRTIFTHPEVYSELGSAGKDLETLLYQTIKHLPEPYQKNFRKTATSQDGCASYDNIAIWDNENPSQLFTMTNNLGKVNVLAHGKTVLLTALNVSFTYADKEEVKNIILNFNNKFVLCNDAVSKKPLITRLALTHNSEYKTISEGKEVLNWCLGRFEKFTCIQLVPYSAMAPEKLGSYLC